MIDLKVRIVRELERGPLMREILSKRFQTVPGADFNDALVALQSAGSVSLKGLRYHAVNGAAIDRDQPAAIPLAEEPQEPKGIPMKMKCCPACGRDQPVEQFAKFKRRCRACEAKVTPPVQTSATPAPKAKPVPKKKRKQVARRKPGGARAGQKSADRLTIPSSHSIECVVDRFNGGIAGIELSTDTGVGILQLDVGQSRNLRDWLTRLDLG